MRHANRTAHFWIVGTMIVALLASPVCAQISSATKGQPVVATGASTATSDGTYWDASQYGAIGSDFCQKISAAWSAAGGSGATIDARGITGVTQTCGSSPFPSTASGKLLLGNTLITTTVTWQIPSGVHVEGIGVTGLTSTNNTVIKAGSGLTGAVVQLGTLVGTSGSLSFDAQVRDLTVDAAGIASIGILNNSSQEGSMVEDVNIFDATGTGLLIQATSSSCGSSTLCTPDNSGPYRNINIQFRMSCSGCGTSTNGVVVDVGTGSSEQTTAIRGIDNVTVSGGHITSGIGDCFLVVGYPVQITNSHAEFCAAGIQIGESGSYPTNNVEIHNVSYLGDKYAIDIANAGDILLSAITVNNLTGGGPKVLDDTVTGNTITAPVGAPYYLGYYLLGDATTSNPAVISTNAGISTGWVAPGNLDIIGTVTKHGGSFKIDHPLDPANQYLYHSFVESPDMMNVYNGTVTTDKRGMATVSLPDYFDALNKDFRYQLTAIGSFAQATVAKKIQNNVFSIRTSKPGVEVSWQVTGIRQDAYANAHRIQVEEQKPPRERGHYLHPELFDAAGKQVALREAANK
jgi:hypothetical protein